MKNSTFVSLLSACLLSGSQFSAAAELPGLVVPDALGVNIHFTDPRPGEMEMLAQAGVRWVRMDLVWNATEREKGHYDFAAYDRLMTVLDANKIRFLAVLCYSNPHYDKGLPPSSDEGRAAFARWAAAAVQHFHNRGIVWEMWNEPDIERFWPPKADVKAYSKLALAVGKALREAQPGELYIGPAQAKTNFAFTEDCFRAGLLEYWSAVSVHPYRHTEPETVTFDYGRLRRLIDKYAPKGKNIPIISGEWGYPTVWKNMNEAKQGKLLPRQWLTNLASGVPLSIWYDWHDDGPDPKEMEHHFGMVRHPYSPGQTPVYQPKPAYFAAQTLNRVLSGYRFQKRLAVGTPHDYVMAFAKEKDDVRLVVWTTAASPHTIVIPAPAGRYTATDHAGQSVPPRVADAKGLAIVLTDAPTYLVPERPSH